MRPQRLICCWLPPEPCEYQRHGTKQRRGPNPRGSSCHDAVNKHGPCPQLPAGLSSLALPRDAQSGDSPAERAHKPPRTAATARRPRLQQAVSTPPTVAALLPRCSSPTEQASPNKLLLLPLLSGQGTDLENSLQRKGGQTKAEHQRLCGQRRGREFAPAVIGALVKSSQFA